jgi:hypothetical protein
MSVRGIFWWVVAADKKLHLKSFRCKDLEFGVTGQSFCDLQG